MHIDLMLNGDWFLAEIRWIAMDDSKIFFFECNWLPYEFWKFKDLEQ